MALGSKRRREPDRLRLGGCRLVLGGGWRPGATLRMLRVGVSHLPDLRLIPWRFRREIALVGGNALSGQLRKMVRHCGARQPTKEQRAGDQEQAEVAEAVEEGCYQVTLPYQRGRRVHWSVRDLTSQPMSPMEKGSLPKPTEQAKAAFAALVPDSPAVTLRPMFGNLSAFVNGNMFAGLFGEDLFVKLSEADIAKVRKLGGRDFEVMPGRAMKGYVVVPGTWRGKPAAAKGWIDAALELVRQMPPKATAKKPAKRKTA